MDEALLITLTPFDSSIFKILRKYTISSRVPPGTNLTITLSTSGMGSLLINNFAFSI